MVRYRFSARVNPKVFESFLEEVDRKYKVIRTKSSVIVYGKQFISALEFSENAWRRSEIVSYQEAEKVEVVVEEDKHNAYEFIGGQIIDDGQELELRFMEKWINVNGRVALTIDLCEENDTSDFEEFVRLLEEKFDMSLSLDLLRPM